MEGMLTQIFAEARTKQSGSDNRQNEKIWEGVGPCVHIPEFGNSSVGWRVGRLAG